MKLHTLHLLGYRHKFTYYIRTTNNISHLLKPVEDVIRYKFIYALCEGRHCNDIERQLLSLPIRLGGLGIINVMEIAEIIYANSTKVTRNLTSSICIQKKQTLCKQTQNIIKTKIKKERLENHTSIINNIRKHLTSEELKANDIAQSPGTSSWLSTLPIQDDGFNLTKREFFDAIRLR